MSGTNPEKSSTIAGRFHPAGSGGQPQAARNAIDLYQIHWPAWKGGPESASPGSIEEAVGALANLKAEGKIRHIGVSNFNAEQMERAQKIAPIASLQPPYLLLSREIEDSVLPYAREQ